MTETLEQWIEREARAARSRFGSGSASEWKDLPESFRRAWRNVVAPYYQDPVADADTLRDLREIALMAYLAHPHAKDAGCMVDPMESAVTAVLRAAKPCIDYEQIRVAFADCKSPKEWADYINSRIRYRFELPKPEPVRVPVDVDGLARVMCDGASRESERYLCAEWNSTSYRDSFRAAARAALAYLNIEPCAKPEYDPNDVAFRDALKKSQEIVNNWTPEQRNHNSIGYVGLQDNERAELENLRVECRRLRHEVEVERDRANDLLADKNWAEAECERLCVKASYTTAKAERQRKQLHSQCKTIESRGAEIARLENEVKRLRTHRREWTEQDVEELAEAICNAASRVNNSLLCAEWHETCLRDNLRAGARAALAWFDGKRGDV